MKIHLNERMLELDEAVSLFQLRDREKPGADVLIYNGAAVAEDVALNNGDRITLIQRAGTTIVGVLDGAGTYTWKAP